MNSVSIRFLGIGAVCLESKDMRLYIDAFNDRNAAPEISKSDILLFTHDDGDHFLAEMVERHYQGNLIIGPPSIAYPLLTGGIVTPDKLVILYPQEKNKPQCYTVGEVCIQAFNTTHSINWEPVHISFLIEICGKRIYVTGDSGLDHSFADIYSDLDCLVYSLILEDVVKDRMPKVEGVVFHLSELLDIKRRYHPRLILCNHLLHCDWTVDAKAINDGTRHHQIEGIFAPDDSSPYEIGT